MKFFKSRKKQHTKEWIQEQLIGIDALEHEKQPKASQSDFVAFSLDVDTHDFDDWQKEVKQPTFQEKLLSHIIKKGMKNSEFYKAAYIDRKLFSAIYNDKNYQPKKETAVACCLGLRLKLSEAEKLLSLAGYSLSLSILWDRVVYYCIDNGITDIDAVNELLDELGEKCIRV